MSFLESLKRLFGGTGQSSGPGGTDSSEGCGSSGETAGEHIICQEASARLFEYLDGELEDVSEEEVRRHLEVCEACYPRVQFEKHFMEALRRSQNGGQVSQSLRARVLQSLGEEERLD